MTRCKPEYPVHTVIWESRLGELLEPFACWTGIMGYAGTHELVAIGPTGLMTISKGYIWDFGSGPAIDTPEMIKASLVHDAWYDLMTAGAVPWSAKRNADKLLRIMLKEAGTGWLRRWYVYWAVRAFGGRRARARSK